MQTSSSRTKQGLFDQIDAFFNSKKPSEVSLVLMVVALVIGYLVYQYIFLITDRNIRQTQNSIVKVKQRVNQDKSYLRVNTPAKLSAMRKEVARKKIAYDDTIYKMSYVDNTLTELSYLLFDDRSWAGFVDDISFLAKKYGVDITEIGNKFFDPTYQKITHVVEVDVKANGGFKNTVKFLNAIEESKLVIDVNDINISRSDENLQSIFKIAVWGMKY